MRRRARSEAPHCRGIVATGQTSIKTSRLGINITRMRFDGYMSGHLSAEAENRGVDRIAAMREAVGPEIEVLIG